MPSPISLLSVAAAVALLLTTGNSSPVPHDWVDQQQPVHYHHGYECHHSHQHGCHDDTYHTLPFGSPGCGKSQSTGGHDLTIKIPSSGGEREFLVHLPASYHINRPSSVVFAFHPYEINIYEAAAFSHLNDSQVNPDMITVFPQGLNCSWEGAPYSEKEVSDKQFTTDMIRYMLENYCVNSRHFYAAGLGIGGGFVNSLACSKHHGGAFAAFAMVDPVLYTETHRPRCHPERPMPIFEITGLVPDAKTTDIHNLPPEKFLQRWAKRDHCHSPPDTWWADDGSYKSTSYNCTKNLRKDCIRGLEFCKPKDARGQNSIITDAGTIHRKILKFFKKHSNPHA